MSQSESEPTISKVTPILTDAPGLPIYHVNVLNVRHSVDEFFITLGIFQPPDQPEMAEVMETGRVNAQPLFRFAVSRGTMEQFLAVLTGQYDRQTELIKRLNSIEKRDTEISKPGQTRIDAEEI